MRTWPFIHLDIAGIYYFHHYIQIKIKLDCEREHYLGI